MRRIGRIAAVAAAILLGAVSARAGEGPDQLAKELRERSRALASLYDRLATEEGARTLVDAIASGKAEDFAHVYEGLELPVHDRCAWVRDAIEVLSFTPKPTEECHLKDSLTQQERVLYYMIAMRHGQLVRGLAPGKSSLFQVLPAPILSGPFLDELKANGLVQCKLVFAQSGTEQLLVSSPYRFCLQELP
ncbi:MAG: hypothetical protein ABW221_26980 [Vicinamibacteria bacterium]